MCRGYLATRDWLERLIIDEAGRLFPSRRRKVDSVRFHFGELGLPLFYGTGRLLSGCGMSGYVVVGLVSCGWIKLYGSEIVLDTGGPKISIPRCVWTTGVSSSQLKSTWGPSHWLELGR